MTLWKRVKELVKQFSKKELTLPKVMVYPPYFWQAPRCMRKNIVENELQ